MGLLKVITIVILTTLLQSCGVQLDTVLKSPVRSLTQLDSNFFIQVPATDGTDITLDNMIDRPTVIVFAQDTCDVCGHETEMLLSHLDNNGTLKINLITILIGTTLDDAQWWQEMFEVSWPVGLDYTGNFFKRYCSKNTVPCLLIYKPNQGIVFSRHGEVDFETITNYTGSWY